MDEDDESSSSSGNTVVDDETIAPSVPSIATSPPPPAKRKRQEPTVAAEGDDGEGEVNDDEAHDKAANQGGDNADKDLVEPRHRRELGGDEEETTQVLSADDGVRRDEKNRSDSSVTRSEGGSSAETATPPSSSSAPPPPLPPQPTAASSFHESPSRQKRGEGESPNKSRNRDEHSDDFDEQVAKERERRLGDDVDADLTALVEGLSAAKELSSQSHISDGHDTAAASNSNSAGIYANLHSLARTACASLNSYAASVEMGLVTQRQQEAVVGGDSEAMESSSSPLPPPTLYQRRPLLCDERRERFRSHGQTLWMKMRSNPEVVRDAPIGESDDDNHRHEETKNDSYDMNAPKERMTRGAASLSLEERKHRAAASGYIRYLATRLVLVDFIRTASVSGEGGRLGEFAARAFVPSMMSDFDDGFAAMPSVEELSYGLRSFSRAGRALLTHASATAAPSLPASSSSSSSPEPTGSSGGGGKGKEKHCLGDPTESAYDALSLAVSCWHVLERKGSQRHRRNQDSGGKDEGEARDTARMTLEEAFEAVALLPDAASVLGSRTGCGGGSSKTLSAERTGGAAGNNNHTESTADVVQHLKRAQEFVFSHCCVSAVSSSGEDGRNGASCSTTLAATSRYLPSLARLGYKHGSRLARQGDNAKAFSALKIALGATNRCLAELRGEISRIAKDDTSAKQQQSYVSSKSSVAMSRQERLWRNVEQDMLVLSKQSLYVLSQVCQAMGKKGDAHKCLDHVQKYIDEQRASDERQFDEMLKCLAGGGGGNENGAFPSSVASALALEGPKRQDKADIKARGISARDRARRVETKERANLAFSRIMINHQTMPAPSAEEEEAIDEQLKALTGFSQKVSPISENVEGPSKRGVTTKHDVSNDDEVFQLALHASRVVHVRRLTATASGAVVDKYAQVNPYELLSHSYPEGHFRHNLVMLDHIRAILVTIEAVVRNGAQLPSIKSLATLDEIGLEIGNRFIKGFKSTYKSAIAHRQTEGPNTTLFAAADASRDTSSKLLVECHGLFAWAVSLYRSLDGSYSTCARWSDLLILILELAKQGNMTSEVYGSNVSKEDFEIVIAEALAVKAHCLSMSGSYAAAMKTARSAFSKGASTHNVLVLFHCAVARETKEGGICDALLELDSALSELFPSNDAGSDKILPIFPFLSSSCVDHEAEGGGPLLLGVQERWLKYLVRSDSFSKSLKKRKMEASEALAPPGGSSLFVILRAYLRNLEIMIASWKERKDHSKTIRSGETLTHILDSVLKVLQKVRDRKPAKARGSRKKKSTREDDGGTSDFALVWDDKVTQAFVGDHKDCIWVAEQVWNLANIMMTIGLSDEASMARHVAADLFASSHDVSLLSEEEDGAFLSKGHLDCDQAFQEQGPVDFADAEKNGGCDLASEFSAQCLLLSVANAIDYAASNASAGSDRRGCDDLMRRSLNRVTRARAEFTVTCENAEQKEYVNGLSAFLALRCIVEIGDDLLAVETLGNGGLLDNLGALTPANSDPSVSDHDGNSTLRQVYMLARRADDRKMSGTARHLYCFCSQELLRRGQFVVLISGTPLTLADLQRRLVQSGSTVNDIIGVFSDVDHLVKEQREKSSDLKKDGQKVIVDDIYTDEELDWFTIEAYNRGLNLSVLGDFFNAEKLLAIALNLLPLCRGEVQSHGREMRTAYSHVVERKASSVGMLSQWYN